MNSIVISRCPRHRLFWAISIEGDTTGERVTPSKCCGRWETVERWPIDVTMAENLERLAKQSAEAARG